MDRDAADHSPVDLLPPNPPAVTAPAAADGHGAVVRERAPRDPLTKAFDWIDQGVRHPRRVLVGLALLGVLVWRVWWTAAPLTSGDWVWESRPAAGSWFPWPSIWNASLGLNGENTFLDAFRFPVYAVDGFFSTLGGSWSLVEKLVYFLPFAVLLPVAGWLLAREILGNTKWTLLTPVLLLGNTFFVIQANSEIPLALAEALACLTLVAFIRAMRRMSLRWGLGAGLLLSVTAAVDIRPAYIGALLMVGYLLVLTVAEPSGMLFRRRAGVAAAAALTFAGSQAYWIVPLLTYHGHVQLPIPSTPDFNIITLEHGIAGVSDFWTGGYPASQVEAPLNPLFMIFPIVAMLSLLRRRLEPELLWLALAGLIAAFLSKTDTAPFGAIYDFMFRHVPGFNLFREGSKFLFPVALAYAILVPASLRALAQASHGFRRTSRRTVEVLMAGSLVLVLALSAWGIAEVQAANLGSTTAPVAQPAAFSDVSALLGADHTHGSVLWLGQPVYVTSDQRSHRYVIASNSHPMANLSGNATTTQLNRRDYFQYFCPAINQAFCYLTPQLFPYLASVADASYVVSPANVDMGLLPNGITPAWVRQQLDGMFGRPREVGAPGSQLLVWHIKGPRVTVGSYPAVALVDSGPWALSSVLPALQAMGLPAAYRQSLDSGQFPAVTADLPQSVAVLPRVDGACVSSQRRTVGVMVRSSSSTVALSVDGATRTLPRLAAAGRTPGWSLYGPITAPDGTVALAGQGVAVGPCIAWTPLTQAALGARAQTVGAVRVGSNGERVTASFAGAAGPWMELHRFYDSGWRLNGQKPAAVGDGFFNLYHVTGRSATAQSVTFKFSTFLWEWVGRIIAFLTVAIALVLIWRRRRSPDAVTETPNPTTFGGTLAPLVAAVGVIFLGLMALATVSNWFGVPSRYPSLALLGDPYSLDIVLGSVAVGVLLLSIVVRAVEHLTHRRSVTAPAATTNGSRRWVRMAGLVALGPVLLASCGGTSIENANQILAKANEESTASRNVTGSSLDEARVQFQAKHPYQCVKNYTTALKTFPGLVSAYAGRAACYQSFDPGASVHDLSRALSLSPGDPNLLLSRAQAERAAGYTGSAVGDYEAAAAAPSASPTVALTATDGLIAIGSFGGAATAAQTLNTRFPSDAVAQLSVFDLALAQGNDAVADQAMASAANDAAQNSSEMVSVLTRQCGLDVLRHQYLPAVATCQNAAVQGSDSSGAFDNLSAAHLAFGQLDNAISDLSSAIGAFEGNVGPNAQPAGVDGFGLANLFEARGRLYIERHQTALALKDYRSALRAVPPGAVDLAARLKQDIKATQQG
jgi:tetratricopeptide (TPR) repeat protein